MKKYLSFIILILISFIFFYKSIFFFKVPFPGDILIADYFPFKYESYLGYNPGSYPNKAQYFDVIRQMYPWKIFSVSQIKSGQFPLWNPYNFSGMPLFANDQSAVLNPFNLLFFALTPTIAWTIFIYLQCLLASIFTYLYLKTLKLSSASSILGATTFAYCLFMGVFLEYGNFGYSILYLPLMLLAVEKIFQKKNQLWGPTLTVAVAFCAFSGHLQLFGGVLGFVVIYLFARWFFEKNNKSSLISVLLYLILGIGLSMIQLIPTFELIRNAARVTHNADVFQKNILLQVNQLILFFAPDAYGNPAVGNYLLKDTYPGNAVYVGIIPLIFAFFSLYKFRKIKYVAFFSVFTLLAIIFLTNNPLANVFYSLNISFISSSAPSNFMFLLSFSISVLCAFGVEEWTKNFDKKIFVSVFLSIGLFVLFFILSKVLHVEILTKQLLFGVGIFGVSIIAISIVFFLKRRKFVYILLLIIVFDLFYYFIKFNPFVPASTVFPKTPLTAFLKSNNSTKVWGYSAANMESNFATYYGIYSPEGYDPLYPKWYGKFIYSSLDGKLLSDFSESTRSDALIINGYGEKDLRENSRRLKLLDEMGVGQVLDRPESATSAYTFDPKRFEKVYDTNGFTVYNNLNAKPRAYLATNYSLYSSDSDFENKFYSGTNILLEKKPNITIDNGKGGSAKIILSTPNRVVVSTNSSSSSLLVLLDTYYPGWSATVDGVKTEILRANYAFRAIAMPRGVHTVIFTYKPQSFYLGVLVTIISSLGVIGIYIFLRRKA